MARVKVHPGIPGLIYGAHRLSFPEGPGIHNEICGVTLPQRYQTQLAECQFQCYSRDDCAGNPPYYWREPIWDRCLSLNIMMVGMHLADKEACFSYQGCMIWLDSFLEKLR